MGRLDIRKLASSGPSSTIQALINIVSIVVTVIGIILGLMHTYERTRHESPAGVGSGIDRDVRQRTGS